MAADSMDVLAEKLQIFRDEPVRLCTGSSMRSSALTCPHNIATPSRPWSMGASIKIRHTVLQETFLAVAGVAEGLVAHASLAQGVCPDGATVRHLEAVSNVLHGSAQRDRLYLSRLESGLLPRVCYA